MENKRIYFLDIIRGILIILVVLFHLCYDLHEIFGVRLSFMDGRAIYVFRDCFVSLLIFLSGVSCNLSRSNVKRGIRTLGCAAVISLVTALFLPEEKVLFGILHFLGTAMILYGVLFGKTKQKKGNVIGTACMLCLFCLTFQIYDEKAVTVFAMKLGNRAVNLLLFIAGFDTGCFSSDYYPLIPWIFMFFAGAFAGRGIREWKLPDFFYQKISPVMTWIGSHTLWIYMLHQPVIYGLLYFIFKMT